MRQKNTDLYVAGQKNRRKNAIQGAIFSTLFRLAIVALLFWLRKDLDANSIISKLLFVLILLDLGTIVPIWICLKIRLKEIKGGEEDVAAQY